MNDKVVRFRPWNFQGIRFVNDTDKNVEGGGGYFNYLIISISYSFFNIFFTIAKACLLLTTKQFILVIALYVTFLSYLCMGMFMFRRINSC